MRPLTTVALSLAGLLTASSLSFAQPQPFIRQQNTNPYATPPLSPWLNMLRGGSPAANYYLGVVPEFQQRTLNAQFGAQTQMLNQRLASDSDTPEMDELLPTLPGTGHGTQFMNASPYFTLSPYLARGGASGAIGRKPQGRGAGRGR